MDNGDLVLIQWRDSFALHNEQSLSELPADCRWFSIGWVVRQTPDFLTICTGVQETMVEGYRTVDNLLSVPWLMILDWEVVA